MDLRLLLTITVSALIVLRIAGFIALSWWWILLPIWLPASIGIACVSAMGVIWLSMTPKEREAYQRNERLRKLLKANG